MTGHLVLSTLHTNDSISTPARLMDMGVPSWMVAMSLQLVVAQRLVRTICQNCSAPHDPSDQEIAMLHRLAGPDADLTRLRRGKGCPDCSQTGFRGRTGVYEFLEMTLPLIDAITHPQAGVFTQKAREQMAGQTLRRDAVRLVMEGLTTVDEAMRVSAEIDA
jgi:MSHA biogenesis protein MshE